MLQHKRLFDILLVHIIKILHCGFIHNYCDWSHQLIRSVIFV